MITLINPPGIKLSAVLQMQSPNPPLGLAYIAAAVKRAGLAYHVIDATGEALDTIRAYPGRSDFMVQGYSPREVAERVPDATDIVGIGCLFSTLWPLTCMIAEAVRARFPEALLVVGGEHGTAVPEHVLRTSPVDVVVLGEGEETFVALCRAYREGRPLAEVAGLTLLEEGRLVNTGLSPRQRQVDEIPLPDWESFPIEEGDVPGSVEKLK